jgi:hypothetical protein
MSAVAFGSAVRVLARYLGGRFGLLRVLAAVAFVTFAGITSARWLGTAIQKPLNTERTSVRDTYAVSPVEQDIALLRQWLPVEGKIGYWSELPPFRLGNVRLHLAPLLLDPDWRKYDLVLAAIESPSYQLLAGMVAAQSFARGMQIYRRNPR